ncbi:response regulator transcription factor [Devosia chinhatensis]|uniref:Response regulator transcription factor n=1 Tax=Devosia aurantiaca TaxID=2714858 RepID=A0A6M1SPB7_9HYPH|nr:response regulator transcription factor [Devosia aurantiaca]
MLSPAFSRRAHRPDEGDRADIAAPPSVTLEEPAKPVPPGGSVYLTPRERQVLELLSEGYQNKLIADRMALSEHTVKVHVHNLITKLRVTNRTQAAAALRAGKLAPPLSVRERRSFRPLQLEGRPS